ncbi:MAG: glycosyltransferase family 2 protein [Muribaculaceae bacterium]|nr:glycosyltransferase family 2 protein [Muribaculaceae bacterium]MDE6409584.1 glycosyltransferase family 2 protein [Muribaculaceae bacterium]
MLLSIVILTCNQKTHTLRLLESLIPYLSSHIDVEAVIVDNGSTDGTEQAIRNRLKKDPYIEGRIRIIKLDENRGVATGRNIGLRSCEADCLLILDNDTIITQEAIDGLLEYIISNHSCGICAPALFSPEGELQSSAKPYPGLWLKLSHIFRPGKELNSEHQEMKKRHPWYVIGACQMMRKTTYDIVGPLDERIFYGPEDADYCARVKKHGLTIDYLPEFSIIHDWRRTTRRNPLSRLAFKHFAGLIRFWTKRY